MLLGPADIGHQVIADMHIVQGSCVDRKIRSNVGGLISRGIS